jgi:hypothetical protein
MNIKQSLTRIHNCILALYDKVWFNLLWAFLSVVLISATFAHHEFFGVGIWTLNLVLSLLNLWFCPRKYKHQPLPFNLDGNAWYESRTFGPETVITVDHAFLKSVLLGVLGHRLSQDDFKVSFTAPPDSYVTADEKNVYVHMPKLSPLSVSEDIISSTVGVE